MNRDITIKRFGLGIAAVALVASMGACAGMAQVMSGKSGMTYYTFDKDTPHSGKSACYGMCATNWPPVSASEANGHDFGSITRNDGSHQLTYDGRPLYYFIGDKKPGDRKGDGLKGVWHVVSESEEYEMNTGSSGNGGSGGY